MPESAPRLLGLSGSIRRESLNTAVLRTLAEALQSKAVLDIHPLDAIPAYNGDLEGDALPEPVRALKVAIAASDGIVLCSPEYNWGMSGVLKNALDWASRPAYASPLKGKPALLMSASQGAIGGARAHAQMREIMAAMLARVVARPPVTIAAVNQKIVGGMLIDAEALKFALAAIDDLIADIHLISTHAA